MRRIAMSSLVASGLLLTGCAAPHPPEVTFFADGTTLRLDPSQYCRPEADQCDGFPQAKGTMRVPGGQPLNISVPAQVADAPWVVVFRYRAADGSEQQGRTPIFKVGEKYAYTLRLPTAADQLTDVEVQRVTSVSVGANNELVFVTDASWVLEVSA